MFQMVLQGFSLLQHLIHHHIHPSPFTSLCEMVSSLSWRFDHHFPGVVPCPFTSKEIVQVLGPQEYIMSPHHKLQLLCPRIDKGCPHRFNSNVRSIPDPHPHPLAVAGLSRLAEVCKGFGDCAEVMRVDALEDALTDDVLVEEANEGDGGWVQPAERVVRLVLGPKVSFTNPIRQRSVFVRLGEGAVDWFGNDEDIFSKLIRLLRTAAKSTEKC